jgi:hypothetical protein
MVITEPPLHGLPEIFIWKAAPDSFVPYSAGERFATRDLSMIPEQQRYTKQPENTIGD